MRVYDGNHDGAETRVFRERPQAMREGGEGPGNGGRDRFADRQESR